MAEIQIAWLELMTVGGLGVILVLLGVTFNIIRDCPCNPCLK